MIRAVSRLRRTASLGLLGLACICLLAAGAVPTLGASPEPSSSASAGPAASPSPVTSDVLEPVDPRSEGSGPGIVGSPLVILLGVVGLGILSALITAAWVRLTRQG